MIKLYKDNKTFLEICDKLRYVKDCELKQNTLYTYMIGGLYNKRTFTFASYDEDKMNGCLILTLIEFNADLCLNILFVWIDRHYPKLWKEYMKFIEEKAEEFKVKKIISLTRRNAEAIERKYGKYGYENKYNVIVKEVS